MGKGKKKKLRVDEEEVFHVEVITEARVSEDGDWEYFVKWAGYPSSSDSWEPAKNVQQCVRLLESFWRHIGTDNKNYQSGDTFRAKPEWINDERKFFQKEFGAIQREEAWKKEQAERKQKEKEKAKKQAKERKKESKPFLKSVKASTTSTRGEPSDLNDSDDDEPLRIKLPALRKKRALSSDEESDIVPNLTQPPRKISKTVASTDKLPARSVDKGKQKAHAPPPARQPSAPPNSPTSLFSGSDRSSPETSLSKALPTLAPQGSTSSSGVPVPVKNLSMSSSQSRQSNARGVKFLEIPTYKIVGGSTLSTKQRLAAGMMDPTGTKVKPPVPPPVPPPRISSISSLSFKKTSLGTSAAPTLADERLTIEAQQEPPMSPVVRSAPPEPFSDPGMFLDIVESPIGLENLQDEIPHYEPFDPDMFQPVSPIQIQTSPTATMHVGSMEEANKFLSTIMPPALAAPILEPEEPPTTEGPIPPKSLIPAKAQAVTSKRIPKKWKWSGELFMNNTRDSAEHLCDVTLTDSTDHLPEGLRFSVIFSCLDSLRVKKMYELVDVEWLLRACSPVQQLAKVIPQDDKDSDSFAVLTKYMAKKQTIASANMLLDNVDIGLLLVFPTVMKSLCTRLKVPLDLQQKDTLVAALFSWSTTPSTYSKFEWRVPITELSDNSFDLPVLEPDHQDRSLRNNSLYHHAIRVLKFPKHLADYMSMPKRPYCVWWSGGDGTTAEGGLETTLLHAILEQCRAKNVGHKADVRVVFVHIGALRTLHKLPALAERRSKRFEVQFFTYGTHDSVVPEHWGIHEIYPLGGIVTFTPGALVDDPFGSSTLITQISEHPLWDCYLLPSAIGMVAKLTCGDDDPLSVFDNGDFLHVNILKLVEDGQASLLQAPRPPYTSAQSEDSTRGWISTQIRMMSLDARGLLEECMKQFNGKYPNISESGWSSAVEAEVSDDLSFMQMQPVIMQEYRRYVVIKGPRDDHIEWDKDGFEWTVLSKFDFKDDFFQKTSEDMKPEASVAKVP